MEEKSMVKPIKDVDPTKALAEYLTGMDEFWRDMPFIEGEVK